MHAPLKPMTTAEFWEFVITADPNYLYEFVNGEVITMSPSSPINSNIAFWIGHLIQNHVTQSDLGGFVTTADGGFEISPGIVRAPDVAYLSLGTAPKLEKRMQVAPDFVVEVISPSERHTEIRQKIDEYLQAGVRLVWIVYPDSQTIDVWQQQVDGQQVAQTYAPNSTILADPVLPELSIPLSDIFRTNS